MVNHLVISNQDIDTTTFNLFHNLRYWIDSTLNRIPTGPILLIPANTPSHEYLMMISENRGACKNLFMLSWWLLIELILFNLEPYPHLPKLKDLLYGNDIVNLQDLNHTPNSRVELIWISFTQNIHLRMYSNQRKLSKHNKINLSKIIYTSPNNHCIIV